MASSVWKDVMYVPVVRRYLRSKTQEAPAVETSSVRFSSLHYQRLNCRPHFYGLKGLNFLLMTQKNATLIYLNTVLYRSYMFRRHLHHHQGPLR